MAELWWRHRWMEAVYGSELKPLEVFVASIYADHAHDKRTSWVTLARLMERTHLSRDAANRALRGLRDKGWLQVVQEAKQHRATVYGLVIPDSSSTGGVPLSSTPDVPLTDSSSTPHDTSSTGDDTSSTPRVPNQVLINDSSISLSPEQVFVKDLLGLDERDEMLKKIPTILQDHNVRAPKPWLRTCHQNGELLDLLQQEVSTSTTWGIDAEDERTMPNPNYIEGTNEPRVDIERWHRARMDALGLQRDEVDAFHAQARRNYPNGKPLVLWREALMNAQHDVKENPRCEECGSRLDHGHYRTCSQAERHHCESCNATVGAGYLAGVVACPECKHKHQILKETA